MQDVTKINTYRVKDFHFYSSSHTHIDENFHFIRVNLYLDNTLYIHNIYRCPRIKITRYSNSRKTSIFISCKYFSQTYYVYLSLVQSVTESAHAKKDFHLFIKFTLFTQRTDTLYTCKYIFSDDTLYIYLFMIYTGTQNYFPNNINFSTFTHIS